MELVTIIILCWMLLELLLWLGLSRLRSDFQWLIMDKDELPELDQKALEKFAKKGMDPELGWVRKPHSSGQEKGRNGKKTQFSVNALGARSNPGYDGKYPAISLFGDSYAFGRQVNDDETWSHLVSKQIDLNILNFGVGNYGLDQAILRMQRELSKHQSQLTIIMVVPETICRIQTTWKHYSEYGNTLAFKPRFLLNGDQLIYKKNLIDKKEKYLKYADYLDEIKSNDYFYKAKFKRDILTFPYTISLARSSPRNCPLLLALLKAKISNVPEVMDRPFQMILRKNHQISMSLYYDDLSYKLIEALVRHGKSVAKQHNSKFLFCMVPQLQDIELIEHHGIYYQPLLDRLSQFTNVLNLTDIFTSQDKIGYCYTNDMYGGHLSRYGNELVADIITEKVRQLLDMQGK